MELPDITQQIVQLATAYRLSVEENKELRRINHALLEENNLLKKQVNQQKKRHMSPEPEETVVNIARKLSYEESQPLVETQPESFQESQPLTVPDDNPPPPKLARKLNFDTESKTDKDTQKAILLLLVHFQ